MHPAEADEIEQELLAVIIGDERVRVAGCGVHPLHAEVGLLAIDENVIDSVGEGGSAGASGSGT